MEVVPPCGDTHLSIGDPVLCQRSLRNSRFHYCLLWPLCQLHLSSSSFSLTSVPGACSLVTFFKTIVSFTVLSGAPGSKAGTEILG